MEPISLSGYLSKQGAGLSKAFKRRFFLLKNSTELHYYKSEKDSIKPKSQGFINLQKVLSVERGGDFQSSKRSSRKPKTSDGYFFDVVTQDRVYHLATSSEQDQLRWMDGISHIVRSIRPETTKPIQSLFSDMSRSHSSFDIINQTSNSNSLHQSSSSITNTSLVKSNSFSDMKNEVDENRLSMSIDCSLADCEQLLSAIDSTLEKHKNSLTLQNISTNIDKEGPVEREMKLQSLKEQESHEEALKQLTKQEIKLLNDINRIINKKVHNSLLNEDEIEQSEEEKENDKIHKNLIDAYQNLKKLVIENEDNDDTIPEGLQESLKKTKLIKDKISLLTKELAIINNKLIKTEEEIENFTSSDDISLNSSLQQLKKSRKENIDKVISITNNIEKLNENDKNKDKIDILQKEKESIEENISKITLKELNELSNEPEQKLLLEKSSKLRNEQIEKTRLLQMERDNLKRIQRATSRLSNSRRLSGSIPTTPSNTLLYTAAFQEAAKAHAAYQSMILDNPIQEQTLSQLQIQLFDISKKRKELIDSLYSSSSELHNKIKQLETEKELLKESIDSGDLIELTNTKQLLEHKELELKELNNKLSLYPSPEQINILEKQLNDNKQQYNETIKQKDDKINEIQSLLQSRVEKKNLDNLEDKLNELTNKYKHESSEYERINTTLKEDIKQLTSALQARPTIEDINKLENKVNNNKESYETEIKQKDNKIIKLKQKLSERPKHKDIEDLENQIKHLKETNEKEQSLYNKEKELFKQEILQLKQLLESRPGPEMIKILEKQLDDNKEQLNKEIKEKENIINNLNNELSNRPQQNDIYVLENTINDLKQSISNNENNYKIENNELHTKINELQDQLQSYPSLEYISELQENIKKEKQEVNNITLKYKEEIEKLENELQKRPTQDNLHSLENTLNNTNQQILEQNETINSLRKQLQSSPSLEKINKLQEDLEKANSTIKINENQYNNHINELNNNIQEYMTNINNIKQQSTNEIQLLNEQISTLCDPTEYHNIKEELNKYKIVIKELENENESYKKSNNNDNNILKEQNKEYKHQIDNLEKENKELSNKITLLLQQIEETNNSITNNENNSMNNENINKQLEEYKKQLQESENEKEELNNTLLNVNSSLKQLEDKIKNSPLSVLEQQLRKKEQEYNIISELYRTLEEDVKLNEHDYISMRTHIKELENEIKSKDNIILSIQTQKSSPKPLQKQTKQQSGDLKRELSKLLAANQAHQFQNSQMEREIRRVQEHYKVKLSVKDTTIDKLKTQLDQIRNDYQNLRKEALVKSGLDDNTVKELDSIAYVKQEYFYSLALGLKLELSSRGTPCNLNIGELFQEALYTIPVQEWNTWLAKQFKENDSFEGIDKQKQKTKHNSQIMQPHIATQSRNTNKKSNRKSKRVRTIDLK